MTTPTHVPLAHWTLSCGPPPYPSHWALATIFPKPGLLSIRHVFSTTPSACPSWFHITCSAVSPHLTANYHGLWDTAFVADTILTHDLGKWQFEDSPPELGSPRLMIYGKRPSGTGPHIIYLRLRLTRAVLHIPRLTRHHLCNLTRRLQERRQALCLAFLSALHPRLGASSPAAPLDQELSRTILRAISHPSSRQQLTRTFIPDDFENIEFHDFAPGPGPAL